MSMEFTLNDLQRRRVEEHLALVEQVLRRSIKTNETVDGMGHDDLYQDGCIALCRASVSYREEMGAFPAYARTVIRNYLLDRCREIQSARKNLPLLSLDAFAEMGAPEPVSPFHTEDLISDVSSDALLSHFRNRYHGTARLGIEALELRVRGYSCADSAMVSRRNRHPDTAAFPDAVTLRWYSGSKSSCFQMRCCCLRLPDCHRCRDTSGYGSNR